MGIEPIKKVNVGEVVFEQLQNLLIQGEWKIGEKLPSENELAGMFGVSRITIRQALQKLSAYGLVETRLGEGSFVRQMDISESINALIPVMYLDPEADIQIFEFRTIIDSEAAGLAAERASGKDIKELEEILNEMIKNRDKGNLKEFASKDLEFHFKICQITGNKFIMQTNMILKRVLMLSMNKVIDRMGCEPAIYYHEKIIQAIEKRERNLACNLMREHISKNVEYFGGEEKCKNV